MNKRQLPVVIVFALMLTITGTGCDQIKGIFQYFSKDKQQAQTPPANETEAQAQPAASAPAAQNVSADLPPDVVVRINNWMLTKKDFDERLSGLKELVKDPNFDPNSPETKQLVLEEIIRQQLLVAEAEKNGVAQSKEVQEAVEEFRRSLLVREMATKAVEDIKIGDDEAQKYYDDNKASIISPLELHVREIVVDSQLKANELSVDILKGANFAERAQANSISKSASNGGDLGFISQAPFPEMANVLLKLNPGEVSTVFKGPDGFYIVKLEEKKGGDPIPFEKVKEEIVTGLTQMKQQQAIVDYINKLKENTKIEINQELVK